MLGRARAALGRFVSAAPRTLRKIDRWIDLSIYLSIYLTNPFSFSLPVFWTPFRSFRAVRRRPQALKRSMTNTKAVVTVQPYRTKAYTAEGGSNWSRAPRGDLDPQEVRCWGCAAAPPGACESDALSGARSYACAVRAATWRRGTGTWR